VTYNDQGNPRNILYQGYLAEMFVPYQDPSEGWYYRNYLDEGEYGMGTMGSRWLQAQIVRRRPCFSHQSWRTLRAAPTR
jgi:Cu2+-containing amine oxidase